MDQENLNFTQNDLAFAPHDQAGPEVWGEGLVESFKPYPVFVDSVLRGLKDLEQVQLDQIEFYETQIQRGESTTFELRTEIEQLKKKLQAEATTLPSEKPTSPAPTRRPKPTLASKRVLLLDGAELNRVLVSHYFRGLPVQIDYAKTPDQALGSIEQQTRDQRPYDLVLVDFELKVDGEWVSWIKGQFRHTRLVALSPNAPTSVEETRAIGLGFDSYLSRCDTKATLIEKLSSELWSE